MPKKFQIKLKPKRWYNKPITLQFQSILTQKILMLSKRYKSTEVDRRTWLYVLSGTHWSTSRDTYPEVEIWNETSTYMLHHFKSDLIDNMDNIRIPGTEREKGRDLTQYCDKNPYTHRTIQKATWQHKNATKNFDYTTIADHWTLNTYQRS